MRNKVTRTRKPMRKRSQARPQPKESPIVLEWVERAHQEADQAPPTASETLTVRQSTHGDFSENARVMQGVKRVLRTGDNWRSFLLGIPSDTTLSDVQAEAIEMIVVKLGRIVTGDPNNPDHYLDIEGYARLARERLTS